MDFSKLVTGAVLGAGLAMIGIARILLWQAVNGAYGVHYLLVALTIAGSLVTFGALAGSMLPFCAAAVRPRSGERGGTVCRDGRLLYGGGGGAERDAAVVHFD